MEHQNLEGQSKYWIKTDQGQTIYKRFLDYRALKTTKLRLMEVIENYLDPSDIRLLKRSKLKTPERDILYDTTGMVVQNDYTHSSLKDLLNFSKEWFALISSKDFDSEDKKKEIETYLSKKTTRMFRFINRTSYSTKLIGDKSNFDLYGFCGMTIFEDRDLLKSTKQYWKRVKIATEDVFKLVVSFDEYEDLPEEVFWEREFSTPAFKNRFNELPPECEKKSNSFLKHIVLCAVLPNSRDVLGDLYEPDEKGKYVKLYFYSRTKSVPETIDVSGKQSQIDRTVVQGVSYAYKGRKYFKRCPASIGRDVEKTTRPYGNGYGRLLLVPAQNLDQLRRDLMRVSSFYAYPVVQVPYSLMNYNFSFSPGMTYPLSATGEEIKTLIPQGNFQHQSIVIQSEVAQITGAIPRVEPGQKKARQSQFEVNLNQQQAQNKNIIYKILYLKNCVVSHLKEFFYIMVDNGEFDDLPEGLKIEDIEPSLESIILKEFQKLKAMSVAEAISLASPILSYETSAWDNLKTDYATRYIFLTLLGENFVDSVQNISQIRDLRRLQEEQQRQDELLALRAGVNMDRARALSFSAQAQKGLADAQSIRQGG